MYEQLSRPNITPLLKSIRIKHSQHITRLSLFPYIFVYQTLFTAGHTEMAPISMMSIFLSVQQPVKLLNCYRK